MASRNVADGERHGQDGESEGQRDSDESDHEGRKTGGEDCVSTSAENQPKGSDKFRESSFR